MDPGRNDGLGADLRRHMRDDYAAGELEPLRGYPALEDGREVQNAPDADVRCGE